MKKDRITKAYFYKYILEKLLLSKMYRSDMTGFERTIAEIFVENEDAKWALALDESGESILVK